MNETSPHPLIAAPSPIPLHRWTHKGDRVLIIKLVGPDRRSYGGFLWPEIGPVDLPKWSRNPDCDSGGAFGWAWGIGFGDGKEPTFVGAKWIVFAAHPDDVIWLGGKVKAVPNPEADRKPEVLYCGTWEKANQMILEGQIAWVSQTASGVVPQDKLSSATGDSSASSATGNSSASSATGNSSASSATGNSSASSATGNSSASSATGDSSASSATGYSSASSATGNSSASSATGYSSASSATGNSSASSATGDSSASSATGYSSASSATGDSSASSATGYSSASSATGDSSASSATGERSIAAATGEYSTVEASATGIACTTAEDCWWQVIEGAVFLQRWKGGYRLFTAEELEAKTGDRVRLLRGTKVEHVKANQPEQAKA